VFNSPPEYAADICRAISRRNLSISWICLANPSVIDRELFALMRDAGCVNVVLSCDSGSDRMLAAMNKGFSRADAIRGTIALEQVGLPYSLGFLLGGPGEDRESVEETLAFADACHPANVSFYVGIRILPNTRVRDIAIAEGVIDVDDSLIRPRFYFSRSVQGWIEERLETYSAERPHCRLTL
jgi:radical SAM superfamily enzyme YgiQ (UPF0313 family)